MSAYPSYGLLDRIEILVLPAQQPEPRLEEPFAFPGVGFLVDLGEDRHQLVNSYSGSRIRASGDRERRSGSVG